MGDEGAASLVPDNVGESTGEQGDTGNGRTGKRYDGETAAPNQEKQSGHGTGHRVQATRDQGQGTRDEGLGTRDKGRQEPQLNRTHGPKPPGYVDNAIADRLT